MLLECTGLKKVFSRGEEPVEALRGVSLSLDRGEFASIMGPSGSGKSTLLHLIGGLDRPSEGSVKIDGQSIEKFTDSDLSVFRRRKLGFIFQFFNLLPTLSALENVALPMLLDGFSMAEIEPRATELLGQIGMKHRISHLPDQLSGGEMQRVAIARALISNPLLILADEPTGNLDSKTGATVLQILSELTQDNKNTVLMVTHDPKAASVGRRIITLRDGKLETDARKPKEA